MARTNIPNARERILRAAVKVFAEKSFEGARIEEIAAEAKVPKSLIYYHFDSKDALFEALTENFINEYAALIRKAQEDDVNGDQSLTERMKRYYYDFGQRNADLARVMFIDSLKKSKEVPVLFKVLEAFNEVEKKLLSPEERIEYNPQEHMVAEFFTGFIQNYAYVCFADSWTRYFGIGREEFDRYYMKAFMRSQGSVNGSPDTVI